MNKDIIFLKSLKEENRNEDEYHEHVSRICGLTPYSISVIDFKFLNIELLSAAVTPIANLSALIFTSPRAVEAFAIAIDKLSGNETFLRPAFFEQVRIFVVGKATAKAVSKLGLQSEGQETGSAENLAKYILERTSSDLADKTMLFVHGNLSRETLPSLLKSAGVNLQCICVYETVADPCFLEKFNAHLQIHKNPSFVVFFSPSGAQFYLNSIIEMTEGLNQVKVLAIGKTTCDWLLKSDCHVYGVADNPTPRSLCQTIKKLLEER